MVDLAPMTDDRRLTVQGQERKEQLLDRAAELFAERGYAETRVIDIVRAAGVAKGLFYWYFENKAALFRDLVEQNRLGLRQAQAAAIDPSSEPLRQVRQGSEASVDYMARHARLFSLLEVECDVDRDLVRTASAELAQAWGDLPARTSELPDPRPEERA